jgi:hypothetical protein
MRSHTASRYILAASVALVAGACSEPVTGPAAVPGPDRTMAPQLTAMAAGAGRLVAVGMRETWSTTSQSSTLKWDADTVVVTWSDDGVVWQPVSLPQQRGWLRAVAYGKGEFLAVGGVGIPNGGTGLALRSADGVHWTVGAAPPGACEQLVFWKEAFYASCWNGAASGGFLRSTDAVGWTHIETGFGLNSAFVQGGDVLLVYSYAGISWSADGVHWSRAPITFTPARADRPGVFFEIGSVVYRDGIYTGYGKDLMQAGCCSTVVATYRLNSNDGRSWTAEPDASQVSGREAFGNGTRVRLADRIYAFDDSGDWHAVESFPVSASFVSPFYWDVQFFAGHFVAVGQGDILGSVDGRTWVRTEIPLPG